jgi:hypothetical protein
VIDPKGNFGWMEKKKTKEEGGQITHYREFVSVRCEEGKGFFVSTPNDPVRPDQTTRP